VKTSEENLLAEARQSAENAHDHNAWIQARARFLGKKGLVSSLFQQLGRLDKAARRQRGQELNALKERIEGVFEARKAAIRDEALERMAARPIDLSLPARRPARGRIHPILQTLREIEDIFISMGFDIEEGPDIEDDFHNFEGLNIPADHPARDMHDTFYLSNGLVLRTHTSPVQMRTMKRRDPPLRIIAPGRVYRADLDMSHSPMFHQVEGLMVDQDISMADLKGVLLEFARRLFGADVRIRFRASFFPFTEPSAEVDVLCFLCKGEGCRTCQDTGWLEILGSGMVNPAVFRHVGRPEYDPEGVTGFAFGVGIERIAMLRHGIPDIRTLFENDLRVLHQF